jgi:SAM-dependent methyltransferase
MTRRLLQNYEPAIKEKWTDEYFDDRQMNNPLRLEQFKLDSLFVKKFVVSGRLLDVGCSTGEFLRCLEFNGELYGMEINDKARSIAKEFISFDQDIFTAENFFDVIIFRGTIQHVDIPFQMIKSAYNALKSGGYLIFLATPNTNSILYRLKCDLPFLDWSINFYIPGKKELLNSLRNYGYSVEGVEFPYWNKPYRNFLKDHFYFLLNVFSRKFYKHPFWGSSMNIAAKKP